MTDATAPSGQPRSRRPALLILAAALLAATGNGISLVAFPWLVLQRSGSALDAAVVAGAATLPLVLSTVVAGAAVDMLGRKAVSLISDALSAASVGAVPLVAWAFGADALSPAVFAGLAALGAAFDPAGMTARESMLPEAAARAGWSLDRINSSYEAAFNLAYIVGPGIGGLLITAIGGITTMWVTASAFLLAILATVVLRLDGITRPDRAQRPTRVIAGVIEGLRFVWGYPVLRTIALIEMATTALYLPMESVLFPTYFTERGQPAQLGYVLMALSVGGLVGALGYAVLVRYVRRRTMMLTATITLGLATLVIAFLPPLPVILLLCALIGLVYGPMAPIYNHAMQTRAPVELRGRVIGVMSSLVYAAGPVGFLIAGPLADAAGLTATFLALGVPMLLIGLIAVTVPSLRELDGPASRRNPPLPAGAGS